MYKAVWLVQWTQTYSQMVHKNWTQILLSHSFSPSSLNRLKENAAVNGVDRAVKHKGWVSSRFFSGLRQDNVCPLFCVCVFRVTEEGTLSQHCQAGHFTATSAGNFHLPLCFFSPPSPLSFLSNTAPGSNRPQLLCGHGGFIETLECLKTRDECGGGVGGGCRLATFTSQKNYFFPLVYKEGRERTRETVAGDYFPLPPPLRTPPPGWKLPPL